MSVLSSKRMSLQSFEVLPNKNKNLYVMEHILLIYFSLVLACLAWGFFGVFFLL